MATYTCKHCGARASSKCAKSRNVFPTSSHGPAMNMVRSIFSSEMAPFVEGSMNHCVRVEYGCCTPGTEAWEMVAQLRDVLADFDDDAIKELTCRHRWVFDPKGGECINGVTCCKPEDSTNA